MSLLDIFKQMQAAGAVGGGAVPAAAGVPNTQVAPPQLPNMVTPDAVTEKLAQQFANTGSLPPSQNLGELMLPSDRLGSDAIPLSSNPAAGNVFDPALPPDRPGLDVAAGVANENAADGLQRANDQSLQRLMMLQSLRPPQVERQAPPPAPGVGGLGGGGSTDLRSELARHFAGASVAGPVGTQAGDTLAALRSTAPGGDAEAVKRYQRALISMLPWEGGSVT